MHPADHPGPMVFVADLDHPELTDEDRHHLTRVLRLRTGDPLTLGDGRGRWRTAVMGPELTSLATVLATERLEPAITVGFALVKGDRPELIVQKLTELGVDRISPFRAERSVVRWDDDRAAKAIGRMRAVARNAAMQCHRPWLPVVDDVVDFHVLAAEPGAARADRGGVPPSLAHSPLLVGPEGGWSDAERAVDLPAVALGDHVLRAETAAFTAGVRLTALRSSFSGPDGVLTEGG